ncbi:ABC-type multidrug transport system fused ATPase/permease subunit [Nocardioides daedukensis]|uniref:ABC-type multidrug transport system fused ATPase/permease subunit n=1 Tax=Nocardioides daedukensis TaxID=634462 RepID=A0A7Y9S0S0_9ACTN|nr:ABC transporter ATP-binding protein [Nocardioides daedukensis]NYG60202.1 ABC-type multidrug transport system fused ATPase/permease subunit [Nocardioides daedukensis]
MTQALAETSQDQPPPLSTGAEVDPSRTVDWRRLRSPLAVMALVCSAIAALGTTAGTVIAGQLAEDPTRNLVLILAACVIGASLIDTFGKVVWVGLSDRVEGRLREDLLDAALGQPLATLGEQAVGEILDRVDDDTHEVGNLSRWQIWMMSRTVFGVLPMWIVAGVTWWPAWLLFPALAALTWFVVRPMLGEISRRKVIEEMAWTDHAAALEEGVAGRDDLRTSLGQAHVVARVAAVSARVHARFHEVVQVESRLARRAGVLLHALLVAVAVSGVALAVGGGLSVARLVTLFLVTSTFVGQVAMLANHLPDLQAGLGAVIRLRQMLAMPPEQKGGQPVPTGTVPDLDLRGLDFSYTEGSFALRDVTLHVPGGATIALVGRTGSGKSTLASLISRAVEPPRQSVFLGGVDVRDLDLQELRAAVGVVTQRTEILAGTVLDNITLFGDIERTVVEQAVRELGLTGWVAGLPQGLDTPLGPGGTSLSAGEEQLVAFARLLVRDVRVVVLDEATARMDPLTEMRVVAAADRLLTGRTGILIAHRLSTIERAPLVAVLDHGTVVQQGSRSRLAEEPGPFRDLLLASRAHHGFEEELEDQPEPETEEHSTPDHAVGGAVGGTRRTGLPPSLPEVGTGPSLARGITSALLVRPAWGIAGAALFLFASLLGAQGAVTGLVWGRIVEELQAGETPSWLVLALAASLLAAPLMLADAFWRYPRWWIEVMLRTRMSILFGQTAQRRLPRTPAGEVVARSMDADRYARYADRWVDFFNGMVIAAVTALLAGTWLAGLILLAVLVASALASAFGRPIAGRSAAAASTARASFGRALVSSLESVRTVKLAAATPDVRRHLREVDSGRVDAAVREHRVQAFLDGVPMLMVQCGVVAAWAFYFADVWGLAIALLVANAVSGFDWFGRVAGMVVTEAPGTRAWQQEASRFAGGVDLMHLPEGVDLVTGDAPAPAPVQRVGLRALELRDFSAVHDDGTIGVFGVNLEIQRGELVLLVGQVGSGKSSLLSALTGLIGHRGEVLWNGEPVTDPETFMRPGNVSHVAQVPRVLSGTFADNVRLGHERAFDEPVRDARLEADVSDAGGPGALVGHRGVRLSGGQVQRLALARALATEAELVLADDVSSALDASTEIELWSALRARQATVIGASAKRAALARADRVVVLVDGEVAGVGPWSELAPRWGHLAG